MKMLYNRKENNMKCFAGDDCTLVYWYECEKCGTIVAEDNSREECLSDWKCPTCEPVNNYPWQFVTKEDIDSDENAKVFINALKEMGCI
jgi:phage FluMu protein Com